MDEEHGEDFLKEPLRYYGDIDAFKRAVSILTRGEARKQQRIQSALTPIILSGLLAAQQAREEEERETNDRNITKNWPNASELVSYCTTIRKQALIRIAKRRNRRKLRLFAAVTLIGFICGAAYYHTIGSMERSMIELSYTIDPSSNNEDTENEFASAGLVPCSAITLQSDKDACRAAEAQLWAYFRDYASTHSAKLRDCTRRKCSRDSRNIMRRQLCSISGRSSDILEYAQGPYAMHTVAVREPVVLKTAFSKSSFEPWWTPSEEHDGKFKKGLQWIGDTTVNQLVRKRLSKAIQNFKGKGSFRLLDVGCGIGGTLYSLAGTSEDRWTEGNEHDRIDYLGIAISSAEIHNARQLAAEHDMDLMKARFEQQSFDSPSLGDYGKFSAAVAIESLSFSQNLTNTLSNLARVIKSGGTLIVVDDVVNSQYGEHYNSTDGDSVIETYASLASRPSLLSHMEWKNAFHNAGFVMNQAMDIGLEFDLPQLIDVRSNSYRRTSTRGWLFGFRRRGVFMGLLQKWQAWKQLRLGDTTDIQKLAELQTLQLMQQNINFIRSKSFRKEAHEQLELTYNMYVCTKR